MRGLRSCPEPTLGSSVGRTTRFRVPPVTLGYMKPWLVRGLGLALIHVVVRVLLGAALIQWPLQGSVLRWFAFVVVVLAALIWAGIDGIRDRRAHPDPEQQDDLTMRWLTAGAVTGLLGGVLTW